MRLKTFEISFFSRSLLPSLIIGMFIVYEMCVYKKIWIVLFLLLEVDTQETEAIFLGSLFFFVSFFIFRVHLAIMRVPGLSRGYNIIIFLFQNLRSVLKRTAL